MGGARGQRSGNGEGVAGRVWTFSPVFSTAGDGSLTRGQRRAGTVPGSLVRSAVGCRVRAAPQSPGERSQVAVSTSLQVNAKQALEFKKNTLLLRLTDGGRSRDTPADVAAPPGLPGPRSLYMS